MRIIAGEFRSRRISTPPDDQTTRPIPDRVRESFFSLLQGNIEGIRVLDAFAGTGVIGLEAVSRGAIECVFVEKDRKIADILRSNVRELDVEDRCEVFEADALGAGAVARCPRPAGLIFLDPPYPLVRDPLGWSRLRSQITQLIEHLADDGFLALRTPWPFTEPGDDAPRISERADADLTFDNADGPETHIYGTTAVHLYMRAK